MLHIQIHACTYSSTYVLDAGSVPGLRGLVSAQHLGINRVWRAARALRNVRYSVLGRPDFSVKKVLPGHLDRPTPDLDLADPILVSGEPIGSKDNKCRPILAQGPGSC